MNRILLFFINTTDNHGLRSLVLKNDWNHLGRHTRILFPVLLHQWRILQCSTHRFARRFFSSEVHPYDRSSLFYYIYIPSEGWAVDKRHWIGPGFIKCPLVVPWRSTIGIHLSSVHASMSWTSKVSVFKLAFTVDFSFNRFFLIRLLHQNSLRLLRDRR